MSNRIKNLVLSLAIVFSLAATATLSADGLSGYYRLQGGDQEVKIVMLDQSRFNIYVTDSHGSRAVAQMTLRAVPVRLASGHVATQLEMQGTYATVLPDGSIQTGPTTMSDVPNQPGLYEISTYVDYGDRTVLQSRSIISKMMDLNVRTTNWNQPAPRPMVNPAPQPKSPQADLLEAKFEQELTALLREL